LIKKIDMQTVKHNQNIPLLMAHRGLPWDFPENTLLSFQRAIDLGADIIEFDVQQTKDGVLIIMHDQDINRTTTGSGSVSEINYCELIKSKVLYTKNGPYKQSQQIPKLSDLLKLISRYPQIMLNCEFKCFEHDFILKVIAIIEQYNLIDRTVFTSFDYSILEYIKQKNIKYLVQGFPLSLMKSVSKQVEIPEQLFDYIGIKFNLASINKVQKFQAMGIKTGVWVLNNSLDFTIAIQLGVDIITTDRVNILKIFVDSEC
jgi:glycerophosphoryl diester phosphodiesterase